MPYNLMMTLPSAAGESFEILKLIKKKKKKEEKCYVENERPALSLTLLSSQFVKKKKKNFEGNEC